MDATPVVVANAWQAIGEELGNGRQAQNAQYPRADLQAHCRASRAHRDGAHTAEKCTGPCADGSTDQYTAGNDHCHLSDDFDQLVKDAGDIDVSEALSQ
ncbi:hypothetical protein D3C76_1679250 [compost metagenome]